VPVGLPDGLGSLLGILVLLVLLQSLVYRDWHSPPGGWRAAATGVAILVAISVDPFTQRAVLALRGERVTAVVTGWTIETKQGRACLRLRRQDGTPIRGGPCIHGTPEVGDTVEVLADPDGRVDARLSNASSVNGPWTVTGVVGLAAIVVLPWIMPFRGSAPRPSAPVRTSARGSTRSARQRRLRKYKHRDRT
jgi:hypothetical protein